MLIHTLQVNGVPSIDTLDQYVKKDIVNYGTQLKDSRDKMAEFYKELLDVRYVIEKKDRTLIVEKQGQGSSNMDFSPEDEQELIIRCVFLRTN